MKKDYRSGPNRSSKRLNPDGGTWDTTSAADYIKMRREGNRAHRQALRKIKERQSKPNPWLEANYKPNPKRPRST